MPGPLGCTMTDDEVLETLRELESQLHLEATRRDTTRMRKLLHPDFEEFGRSGRRFSREEVLTEFASADAQLPRVVSGDFELARFGEQAALITYVSAHLDRSGHAYRHTLRSSLWVMTEEGWQMRFHQGTPTDAHSESST
jgi:hypothetical protein